MIASTQGCSSMLSVGCSCTKSGTAKPIPAQMAPIRSILFFFAVAAVSTVHTFPLTKTASPSHVHPGYVSSRFIRRQDLGDLSTTTENAAGNLEDTADDTGTTVTDTTGDAEDTEDTVGDASDNVDDATSTDASSDAGNAVTDASDNVSDIDVNGGDNGGDDTDTVEDSGNIPSSAPGVIGPSSNQATNGNFGRDTVSDGAQAGASGGADVVNSANGVANVAKGLVAAVVGFLGALVDGLLPGTGSIVEAVGSTGV